jgi:hypothetical protein
MIGIVVFYVKAPLDVSEEIMKQQRQNIEKHNQELFDRLRKKGFEFMYVPTEQDGSHVDVCFFNVPPGMNVIEGDE